MFTNTNTCTIWVDYKWFNTLTNAPKVSLEEVRSIKNAQATLKAQAYRNTTYYV
jgi:hypothetical protein